MRAARRADQVRDGHGPRRREHPPVHGHVGRRLQAVVRIRRAAVHVRGLRSVRRHRDARVELVHRPSDHVGTHLPQPHDPRSSWSTRASPRPAMAATQHYALRPKSDLTLLYGLAHLLVDRGWIDREFIDAHTKRLRRLRHTRQGLHTGTRERGDRVECRRPRQVRRDHPRGAARVVLVDDGSEPESREHARGAGDHQPRADDRQHRTAGHRRELHHRVSATQWAPACSATPPTCSVGATSPTPPTAPRCRTSSTSTRPASPTVPASPTTRSSPSARRAHQRLVGRCHELGPLLDRSELCPRGTQPARVPRRAGHVLDHRHRAARPPRAARRGLGREGRHVHQLRATSGCRQARGPGAGKRRRRLYIFKMLADAWGCGDLFSEWCSPEATFAILQRLSAGRPCDMTGMGGYQTIDDSGGIQWPLPEGATVGAGEERRLFTDGRFHHPDGRARFVYDEPRPWPNRRRRVPTRVADRPRELE